MSKKHNRRSKQRKGPQLSEGERLWKRMSAAIGNNQELWGKSWDAQSIAELVIRAENLSERFAKEPKSERVFRAKLDQALAEIRKQNQFFTTDNKRSVTLRTKPEIDEIKASIDLWQVFFQRQSVSKELFQGPPIFEKDEDKSRYTIVENAWLAMINGKNMPSELSLYDEGLTRW